MSISTVQAVAEQWGAFVNLSDVVQLTVKHPVMVKAIDLMGYQAAETVDREVIEVLLAGTSVSYPGSIASRSALSSTTTDVVSTDLIRKVLANLRLQGAHEYEGQDFVGVVDPMVEMDISKDSTFTNAASYSNIKVLQNGEIGKWMGVRWMRSNLIPSLTGLAAGSYTTPSSPAGTFAAASYRISTAYYNASTGFLEKITQNDAVAFSALDSLAGTTPADSNYVYKIFISAAAGAAGDIMYVGSETTYGTDFIPASTAFSILAPPSSGDSFADVPAASKVVHFSWVFGKESFTVVDLQKLATYVTPNAASDSDPLAQRRKAGWKLMFKAVINNEEFLERIESLSAF
jgi:N4-gp56 family major capsid protein